MYTCEVQNCINMKGKKLAQTCILVLQLGHVYSTNIHLSRQALWNL